MKLSKENQNKIIPKKIIDKIHNYNIIYDLDDLETMSLKDIAFFKIDEKFSIDMGVMKYNGKIKTSTFNLQDKKGQITIRVFIEGE